MGLPADWTTKRVTAQYQMQDGSVPSGQVVFTAPQIVLLDGTIMLPVPFVAPLDEFGAIAIDLPATNDPDVTPSGWAWLVEEQIGPNAQGRRFYMQVDADGGDIDLVTVAPVVAPPAMGALSAYNLSPGNIEMLDPGSDPTIGIRGTLPNQFLDLGIPLPDPGDVSSVAWGNIGGTLADQEDLQTALDAKANAGDLGTAAAADTTDFDSAGAAAAAQAAAQGYTDDSIADLNLGTASTHAAGDFATAAQGATADATAATVAAFGDVVSHDAADFATSTQGTKADGALQKASNLSDLASAATARDNLGLGDVATLDAGVANGAATLGSDGKLDSSQIPTALLGQVEFQGTWDASAGTPPSGSPAKGQYWIVTTAGTTNVGGITDWQVGDWAIYDTTWRKVDNTDAVASVAGLTGAVSAASLQTALGLGSAAYVDTSTLATSTQGGKADTALQPANNLSDLGSASTARSNLGLGTSATHPATDFATSTQGSKADAALAAANNLSDLGNAGTARTNLGLGSSATHASSDYATAAQGAKADTALQPGAGLVDINDQTGTAYTLVLTDASKDVRCNNASAITLTVPPNSSVAFVKGTLIAFSQKGAGAVTATAGAGVTLRAANGAATTAQYDFRVLEYLGSDEWRVC